MSMTRYLLLFSLMLSLWTTAQAETSTTIDAGRGEVPLFVPANYDSERDNPLIVLLHGYGSSGARQDGYMKFSTLVDRYGFLLATPDGTEEAEGDRLRFWNASSACCNFYSAQLDDSDYVMTLIEQIRDRYRIDPRRIYLIGHSNGGFMSYRMAREHGDVIAAMASLAGAEAGEAQPAPGHAVHVLQIHGTVDETIAYAGSDIRGNAYPGALETIGRWAGYNGCANAGREIGTLDLERNLEGAESIRTLYEGCRPGGSAELWTIVEGGHIPALSEVFSRAVVEWLLARQKPLE